MSLITLTIILLLILLYFKCQYTTCTRDNIFQIGFNLLQKLLFYFIDVVIYMVKKFIELVTKEKESN